MTRAEYNKQPTAPHSSRTRSLHPFLSGVLVLSLVLQLGLAQSVSLDPSNEQGSRGQLTDELLRFTTYLVGVAVLFSAPNALRILRRCWPVLWLCTIAMLSTLWSVHPSTTLRASISLFLAVLFGFSLATFPPASTLKIVIRALAYVCMLSVGCALFIPELGVHQATDFAQIVHAGLWRGILGHKVNLGMFASITLPLLLFYRTVAFRSILIWLVAVSSATACLVFAGSSTGFVIAIIFSALLASLRYAAQVEPSIRRLPVNAVIGSYLLFFFLTAKGYLGAIIVLLGKEPDLTGRTIMWPLISDLISSHAFGRYFGYGYVAGQRDFIAPNLLATLGFTLSDPHNGYLGTLVAFGYVGAATVFLVHCWLIRGCMRILYNAPRTSAQLAAFPISFIAAFAYMNYAETILMHHASILTYVTAILAVWATDPQWRKPASRYGSVTAIPKRNFALGGPEPASGEAPRPLYRT